MNAWELVSCKLQILALLANKVGINNGNWDQMYDKDIPPVRAEFESDGIYPIQRKIIQVPPKFSYGTPEWWMLSTLLSWESTAKKIQSKTVGYAVVHLR